MGMVIFTRFQPNCLVCNKVLCLVCNKVLCLQPIKLKSLQINLCAIATKSADLIVQRRIWRNIAKGIYMGLCLLHSAHLHSCEYTKPEIHLSDSCSTLLPMLFYHEDIAYLRWQLPSSKKQMELTSLTIIQDQFYSTD